MKLRALILLIVTGLAAHAAGSPSSLLGSRIAAIANEAPAAVAGNESGGVAAREPEQTAEAAEIARLEALPPQTIPIQGESLSGAISTIAAASGMNFIAPPLDEFPEMVTMNVKLNPWRLLMNLGQRYRFSMKYADGMWVFDRRTGAKLVAKTYTLKHTNLDAYKASQNSFSNVGAVSNISTPGASSSGGGEGGKVFSAQTQKIIEDIRELIGIPRVQLTGEGEVRDDSPTVQAKSIEAGRAGARVLYIPDQNAIYVVCGEDTHPLVENYLKVVDVRPKQIRIEARFFETTFDPKTVLGINPENFQPSVTLSNLQSSVRLSDFTSQAERATLRVSDVSLQMNALSTDKRSRLVQSPSVTTTNNQEVYFSVGDEEPFVSSNNMYPGMAGGGGLAASTANVSIRRIGTSINILPTIFSGDGGKPTVRLIVRIEVGALKGFRAINSINIPVVSSQKYEYTTYVDDDRVLAFGGLAGIGEVEGVTKVPVLGDAPGIGYLFKSKSREINQRNLIAYIVARVIDEPEEATMPEMKLRDPKASAKAGTVFPK